MTSGILGMGLRVDSEHDRGLGTVEEQPWNHPFLSRRNIERFRAYSEAVWDFALRYHEGKSRWPNCAFAVNMAQNMYKWARLAKKYGADATLYLNPQDRAAISRPDWEEFDGEFADPLDGDGFARFFSFHNFDIPVVNAPNAGEKLWRAYHPDSTGRLRRALAGAVGSVSPWLGERIRVDWRALRQIRARAPTVRQRFLVELPGFYPYFEWAAMLAQHEVIYIATTPFPAYASGKPYCIAPTGGDLQFDCGRTDDWGRAMRIGFRSARFVTVSNPHILGHARRLGLMNPVYLPYPMDDSRYCPGIGNARSEWQARYGGKVFAVSPSRIDREAKGQMAGFFDAIVAVAKSRPDFRFFFLAWGNDLQELRQRIAETGLGNQLILLPPVGKKRLIDYYRSCDFVVDHFVYGYYGATALEAAAIGKPVIMKIRTEHYAPLYSGDVAPFFCVNEPGGFHSALVRLIDDEALRLQRGSAARKWLLRNHGEARTVPLMLALLQLAADRVPLPDHLVSPLVEPESQEERAYHAALTVRKR